MYAATITTKVVLLPATSPNISDRLLCIGKRYCNNSLSVSWLDNRALKDFPFLLFPASMNRTSDLLYPVNVCVLPSSLGLWFSVEPK